MADPKGTYYGPGERGLATVLPSSPNFAGLAQMAQNSNLRRQKLAFDLAEKRNKERENAVNAVTSMLQKGHTTGLIYQNELNERVKSGVSELSKLAESGAPTQEIRAFGAALGQELITYAKSGQQVTDLVDEARKWNQANGKIINEGELMNDIGSKILLNAEGKLRPPQDVAPEELMVENIIFKDKDGAGAKYLNKENVISNLLKNPALKAAVVEHRDFELAEDLPPGKVGVEETVRKTKLLPFATVNAITGEVEIMDAERLVKSPVWQVLLNDRAFMTLVENEVSKSYATKDAPSSVYIKGVMGGTQEVFLPKKENASQEELEFMRGKAAVALLNGTQFSGAQVLEERKLRMQNRFQPRASGKLPASVVKEQNQLAGYDRFQRDILSGDLQLMEDAVSWFDKKLGYSEASRSALSENIGVPPDWVLEGLTTKLPKEGHATIDFIRRLRSSTGGLVAGDATPKGNIIYAKFRKGKDKYEYVPLDVTKMTGTRGFQYYLETSEKFMDYKAEKPGVDYNLPKRTVDQPPIFVNPKIKK